MERNFFAVFGLMGFLVSSVSIVSATILSGQGLTTHFISELGISGYGALFNYGMIVSGFLFVIFFAGFWKNFYSKNAKFGAVLGVVSSLGLIGVGVFPLTYFEHVAATFVFFVFAGLSILFIGIHFFKESKNYGILSFIVVVIDIILLVSFTPITEKIATSALEIWILATSIFIIRNNLRAKQLI